MDVTFRLISSKICPYVQTVTICLLEKSLDFETIRINTANKPDWFLELSPTGKVPVFCIDNEILFESAAICEFIDEVQPTPPMHPQDPMVRAKNRAWIIRCEELSKALFHMIITHDSTEFLSTKMLLEKSLEQLEKRLVSAPYFNGDNFCIIDAAYATLFMRLDIIATQWGLNLTKQLPKVSAWSQVLLARDTVKRSVVPDFIESYELMAKHHNSYLLAQHEKTKS